MRTFLLLLFFLLCIHVLPGAAQTPSTLIATYRGLAADMISPYAIAPDGLPDYRITLGGLRGTPVKVAVTSETGIWNIPADGLHWIVLFSSQSASSGEIYFSEWPASNFHITVQSSDGSSDQADAVKATPPSTLTATFRGKGTDLVSPYARSPDGSPDYHISLGGLRGTPSRILVNSETGIWNMPADGLHWLILVSSQSASSAEIYFSEWPASNFHVSVRYSDGTSDQVDDVD